MLKDAILSILLEMKPEIDFETVEGLITSEVLDSFDIVLLISKLSNQFNIELCIDDITIENFDTIDNIVKLVQSKN